MKPWKTSVLGLCPMATKNPVAGITCSSPETLFLTFTPSTASSPRTSTVSVLYRTSMFSRLFTRCCIALEARMTSRRTSIVTLVHNLAR